MSSSVRTRHLVAAFICGVAIIPATIGSALAWLATSSPEPCSQYSLCFRGLGEAFVSGVVAAVVAGVVAQHIARDATGWLVMMGGLTAAAVIAGGSAPGFGGVVLALGVPATVGYAVIGGLSELFRDAPGQSTDAGSASGRAAGRSRDRDDQCESCAAPLPPHARSCTTCGSAVLG